MRLNSIPTLSSNPICNEYNLNIDQLEPGELYDCIKCPFNQFEWYYSSYSATWDKSFDEEHLRKMYPSCFTHCLYLMSEYPDPHDFGQMPVFYFIFARTDKISKVYIGYQEYVGHTYLFRKMKQ